MYFLINNLNCGVNRGVNEHSRYHDSGPFGELSDEGLLIGSLGVLGTMGALFLFSVAGALALKKVTHLKLDALQAKGLKTIIVFATVVGDAIIVAGGLLTTTALLAISEGGKSAKQQTRRFAEQIQADEENDTVNINLDGEEVSVEARPIAMFEENRLVQYGAGMFLSHNTTSAAVVGDRFYQTVLNQQYSGSVNSQDTGIVINENEKSIYVDGPKFASYLAKVDPTFNGLVLQSMEAQLS